MTAAKRKPTASQEDYLEAILALLRDGGTARVRDIAQRLGVSNPSVSGALKTLARRGWVCYEPYGRVELAAAGRKAAQRVTRRHEVLQRFLTELAGLESATAEQNACRIEHVVDEATMRALRHLMDFATHSAAGRRFLAALGKARDRDGAERKA
ncbi:MAG: metal-dependent transcriptional regulator [Phycisphaerae bacterium]|nr:metal-dependent transcriptional regulator [Phycisphaerae bacterium]